MVDIHVHFLKASADIQKPTVANRENLEEVHMTVNRNGRHTSVAHNLDRLVNFKIRGDIIRMLSLSPFVNVLIVNWTGMA